MQKHISTGVIVARFQVADLHQGHRHLIDFVRTRHARVLIVLGEPDFPTPHNPLPYSMRKHMLTQSYPGIEVVSLHDQQSDAAWSQALDRTVREHCGVETAVLYASRDSFLTHYSGTLPTSLVPELPGVNGTNCRKEVALMEQTSSDFMRGIIYAFETRLAVTRPMVDVAVMRPETNEVLLGGKTGDPEERWRFPGGLVDQSDESLEFAAKREAWEELSMIEMDDFRYVGSTKVDDWRYRGSGESGITSLFRATYVFGAPRAGDDLSRVRWFPIALLPQVLVEEHQRLGTMLINSLTKGARK